MPRPLACGALLAIDESPTLTAWSQTMVGRGVMIAVAVALLNIRQQDVAWSSILVCMAFLYACTPVWKPWILLIWAQSLAIYRILTASRDLNASIVKVVQQEGIAAFPEWQLALVVHGVFMILAWAMLVYARRHPRSLLARHPVVWLLCAEFLLLFVSSRGVLSGMTRTVVWTFFLISSSHLWFVAYALVDQRSRDRSPDAFQLGTFRPFWGFTSLPYNKGAAFLRKVAATTPHDLAVTQLKGLKLLVWVTILYGLHTALVWACERRWHVRTIEDEITAFLSGGPSTLGRQWLSLICSQGEFALWTAVFGDTIVAIARLAGFRLPRSTWRPLESRTLIDYFNRISYYFKELLVDLFFIPTFFTCFKGRPRLRLFFATFMAAGVGNALYHFFRDIALVEDVGLEQLFVSYTSYVFYCVVLAAAIGISQLRVSAGYRPQDTLLGRVWSLVFVWGFVSILRIFSDETRSHTLGERILYLCHLFGVHP